MGCDGMVGEQSGGRETQDAEVGGRGHVRMQVRNEGARAICKKRAASTTAGIDRGTSPDDDEAEGQGGRGS